MPEQDFNTVFSKRLKFYLNRSKMTQTELAKRLGVGTTSVYNWCAGIKSPRMDKIDVMCDIFGCSSTDLMEDTSNAARDASGGYYSDPETVEIAQEIFENRELRILFDAAKHAAPEDLRVAHDMLLALKKKENGYQD